MSVAVMTDTLKDAIIRKLEAEGPLCLTQLSLLIGESFDTLQTVTRKMKADGLIDQVDTAWKDGKEYPIYAPKGFSYTSIGWLRALVYKK